MCISGLLFAASLTWANTFSPSGSSVAPSPTRTRVESMDFFTNSNALITPTGSFM